MAKLDVAQLLCLADQPRQRICATSAPASVIWTNQPVLTWADLILAIDRQETFDGWLVKLRRMDCNLMQIGKVKHLVWGGSTVMTLRFYYLAQADENGRWQTLWRHGWPASNQHQLLGGGIAIESPVSMTQQDRPVIYCRQFGSLSWQPEARLKRTWQLDFNVDGYEVELIQPVRPVSGTVAQLAELVPVVRDCDFNPYFEHLPFLVDWKEESPLGFWQAAMARA